MGNPAKNLTENLAWQMTRLRHGTLVHPDMFHEIPEQRHLRRLLQYLDVDCVFDVGANAGQYGEMLRTKADYSGRIISFEPIPSLANEVRQIAENDIWTVEEVALASEVGEQQFNVMAGDQFSSLSEPLHDETGRFKNTNVVAQSITVKTETLESAFDRLKQAYGFKRPFLKMDTQGLDVTILKSGEAIAKQFVGLQSELAIKRIYTESIDFRSAISFYESLGFELSAFVPNNAGHFPQLIEMDCIMVRSDLMPND